MRRFAAPLLLLAAFCVPSRLHGQASTLSEARRKAIADEIHQQSVRFIDALASRDGEVFRRLFAPDAVYVDAGRIYPSVDALVTAASGFFRGQRSIGGRFDPEHIVVLGPDAAAFTGVFHAEVVDTAGRQGWKEGKIWTFVYQRQGNGWKIVQAHEANRR